MPRRFLLALLTAAVTTVALSAAPAWGATSLTWSTPKLIDQTRPWARTNEINGMSCPTSSLCVAAGDDGKMLTSTDPQDGTTALWSENEADTNQQLAAVSCPSTTLCVAVDGAGNVITTLDPADGTTATWAFKNVDGTNRIRALSCPSSELCVAVDEDGDVMTSTDPADGASAHWVVQTVDDNGFVIISGVSCPSTSLCVAVDWDGNDLVSTNPTAGAAAKWKITDINQGVRLQAVSCPSVTLCAAADTQGGITISKDPGDGAAATWAGQDVDGNAQFRAISCTSGKLCVAVDTKGRAATSINPVAGAAAKWKTATIENTGIFGFQFPVSLSCVPTASAVMCVAGDLSGRTITTLDPADGATATWALEPGVAGENALVGMSCPLVSECVGVDDSGNAFRSSDPADGASATWAVDAGIDGSSHRLSGISCLPDATGQDPGQVFCVASGQGGAVVTATIATGATPTWTLDDVDGTATLTGISCPSLSLCVAVDENGNILTTENPTAPHPSWSTADVDGSTEINAVSCTTAPLCAAVDSAGTVFISTDPADGASAVWKSKAIDEGGTLNTVTCQAFCVAGDGDGNIFASSDPAKGASSTWTDAQPDGQTSVNGVSCPSSSLCIAVDDAGNSIVSTDPGAASPGWAVDTAIDYLDNQLTSVSCFSALMCVAGDVVGNEMAGVGHTLDITVNGNGTGKVTNGTGTISCSTACSASYGDGTSVTITATAAPGSRFTGWGGACSGTGNCTVIMSSDQSVTATFELVNTLTVTLGGDGSGKVTSADGEIVCPGSCSNSFPSDTTETLTATASSGSTFVGWSGGGCSGTGDCTVAMSSDQNVSASFAKNPTLSVGLGGAGAGSVSSGDGTIVCPSACDAAFTPGATVTLTAAAASGSTFTGWSGGGCSGTGTCTVTMSGDQSVTANFALNPRLTVLLGGGGAGAVTGPAISCAPTCSATYAPGTVVTLTAKPAAGSTFSGWSGAGCTGTGTCSVTMGSDQTVTASFAGTPPVVKPSCTLKTGSDRVSAFKSVRRGKHGKRIVVAPKRTLTLTAGCNQSATLRLTGTLKSVTTTKTKGKRHQHTRTFHVRSVTGHVIAGKSLRLTVRLPAAGLARGAKDSASFSVLATNANGTATAPVTFRHLVLF